MLTAVLDTGVFFFQCAILLVPAYRLARGQTVETVLWAGALIYTHYLLALACGRYTWGSALILHGLTVAVAWFVQRRWFPAPTGNATLPPTRAPDSGFGPGPDRRVFGFGTSDSRAVGVRVAFVAVGALLLLGAASNLRTPPGGWDALTYHLEFPAQWVLAGRIFPVVTGYGDYAPTYYPTLIEAFAGWFLLPGRGTAFSDLVQLFFVPMLYGALRDICYHYVATLRPRGLAEPRSRSGARGSRHVSVLAETIPLLVLSLPWLQSSLLVADNDFALCALLLCVWRSALRRAVVALGVAVGLTLALKYTGAVYLAALLLVLGATLWSRGYAPPTPPPEADPPPGQQLWRRGGLALLAAMVFGGYRYLDNYLTTGNPVYPAVVQVGEHVVFAGYYPRAFFEAHPFYTFDVSAFLTDPGLALPLLLWAIGSVAWSITHFMTGKVKYCNRPNWPLLILPILLFLAFYFLIPLRQHRLALPVAALAAPSALLLLSLRRLAPGAWRPNVSLATGRCLVLAVLLQVAIGLIRLAQLYGGVFDIGINMSEFSRATVLYAGQAPLATMSFAGAFVLIAGVLARALRTPRPGGRRTLLGAAAAAILTVMFAVEQSRAPYSGEGLVRVYNWFAGPNKHAVAADCDPGKSWRPGSTGIVGIHAALPLRGPRLENPVRLLLNRPHGDRPLHERAETLQFDPQTRGWTAIGTLADRDIFEANLDRYRIDRLVIASAIGTHGLWPAEYEWVRGRPDAWNCPVIFSNAISGDPGARIAVCRRTNLCGLRGARSE